MPKNQLFPCPRCGECAFERLSSYDHCVSCLHFVDHHYDAESAFHAVARTEKEVSKDRQNDQERALAAS